MVYLRSAFGRPDTTAALQRSAPIAAPGAAQVAAAAEPMSVPWLQARCGGRARRVGLRHPTIAAHGGFVCADARTIVISIRNELIVHPQLRTQPMPVGRQIVQMPALAWIGVAQAGAYAYARAPRLDEHGAAIRRECAGAAGAAAGPRGRER